MAEAVLQHNGTVVAYRANSGLSAGEVIQLPSGRAGIAASDVSSGSLGTFYVTGTFLVTKTTSMKILDGGRCYWDYSANKVSFRKVNDRDFYIGRALGDAESGDAAMYVELNVDPPYDIDLARDAYRTAIVGTATTQLLNRRGGCLNVVIGSTNEAAKVDALSVDGFATGANAIVEFAFAVVSDGAGTVVDVSMGIANATHATDADSITESVFIHLDANDVDINAESDDGTTEVAATDTTVDYTEGSAVANRVECWMDMRNPADVQIYLDGVLVLGSTVFDVSAAVGPWKLLLHVEKTSSTDTYELDLHWMRARFQE